MLLDINTRPSGGLHQLSRCGVNFPWAALQLALGREPTGLEVRESALDEDYTLISTPYPAPGRTLPIPVPRHPVAEQLTLG